MIEVEGPTGLLLTTTAVRIHPENETRLLSITVTDTAEHTSAILMALAREAGPTEDLDRWLSLQEWLETGERRVVVPFAVALAAAIPRTAVRMRRDFTVVLNLIRAHALLHRARRERDAQGRIVGCSPEIARVFTKLTTLSRGLPQGSPSSPHLANLAFFPTGQEIESACRSAGLTVTYFVDDMLISGPAPARMIEPIVALLQRRGYGVKRSKLEILGPHDTHQALGLVYNRFVSYGRKRISELRGRILELSQSPDVTSASIRSTWGKIYYVRWLNQIQGRKLVAFASAVLTSAGLDSPPEPKAEWRTCRRGHCLARRPMLDLAGLPEVQGERPPLVDLA